MASAARAIDGNDHQTGTRWRAVWQFVRRVYLAGSRIEVGSSASAKAGRSEGAPRCAVGSPVPFTSMAHQTRADLDKALAARSQARTLQPDRFGPERRGRGRSPNADQRSWIWWIGSRCVSATAISCSRSKSRSRSGRTRFLSAARRAGRDHGGAQGARVIATPPRADRDGCSCCSRKPPGVRT